MSQIVGSAQLNFISRLPLLVVLCISVQALISLISYTHGRGNPRSGTARLQRWLLWFEVNEVAQGG